MCCIYLVVPLAFFLITLISLSVRFCALRNQNKDLHSEKKNLADDLNSNSQEFSKTKGLLESSEKQIDVLQEELKNIREQLALAQKEVAEKDKEKKLLGESVQKI